MWRGHRENHKVVCHATYRCTIHANMKTRSNLLILKDCILSIHTNSVVIMTTHDTAKVTQYVLECERLTLCDGLPLTLADAAEFSPDSRPRDPVRIGQRMVISIDWNGSPLWYHRGTIDHPIKNSI